MILSKKDQTSIYNGCLSYLRESISAALPENQNWYNSIDFKNLSSISKYTSVIDIFIQLRIRFKEEDTTENIC